MVKFFDMVYSNNLIKLKSRNFTDHLKEAAAKYFQSVINGNYGDNANEAGLSDAEMIQEGINAHRAKKSK